MEVRQGELRDECRRALGITGVEKGLPSFAAVVGASGAGWYVLLALTLLGALDEAAAFVLNSIGPDVSNGLGISRFAFAQLAAQRQTFVGLVALQFAYLFYTRQSRATAAKQLGIGYGVALGLGSIMTWPPGFTLVVGPIGAGGGAVYAAQRPLLADAYPPEGRVRALSIHRAGGAVGVIAAAGLVAVLTGAAGLAWRGAMLVAGALFLSLALLGVRLPDPGYGRYDTDRISRLVRGESGPGGVASTGDLTQLRFGETMRRIWHIPAVPRMLAAWAVLGAALAPLVSYQAFFLHERFRLGLGARSAFFAAAWAFSLPALAWFGRRGDAAYRVAASALVGLTAKVMAFMAVGLVLAVVPLIGVSLIGFGLVFAASAVAVAALSAALFAIVRPRARPAAGALSAIFFSLVGGEGGALLLGGIDRRWSTAGAIVVLALPALLSGWLLHRTARQIDADVDRMIDEVIEGEQIRQVVATGSHLPLLACRNLDFCYGQLQVLFGVNFRVDDGEAVALLGTNGAGKSTLLRVISGLGFPSFGSVRYRGEDITFLDAERRLQLGITQVPGGRAVFGRLTVVDNLRLFAHSLGRDRQAVEQGMDASFDAFPALAERRNQLAATLSGGEQQMLGLARALIMKPKLLLIDELSLGLAPVIVSQLLGMVRRINAGGTAVVLVEQSVNVALQTVEHAYFMEKGEIRFDGRAKDLLRRDDLLRSVFLEGAASGLAAGVGRGR